MAVTHNTVRNEVETTIVENKENKLFCMDKLKQWKQIETMRVISKRPKQRESKSGTINISMETY